MRQLEVEIKLHCRNRNLPLLSPPQPVATSGCHQRECPPRLAFGRYDIAPSNPPPSRNQVSLRICGLVKTIILLKAFGFGLVTEINLFSNFAKFEWKYSSLSASCTQTKMIPKLIEQHSVKAGNSFCNSSELRHCSNFFVNRLSHPDMTE